MARASNKNSSGSHGERKELWDQLDTETERQYEAFKHYIHIDPRERSLLATYRSYSGNPKARSVSPHILEWSQTNAWADRARAYDRHLEQIRRRGEERAIEKEAEKMAREAEQVKGKMYQLMSLAAEKGIEWLESEEYARKDFKAADVINIIKLHVEYQAKIAPHEKPVGADDDWTEEDDDEEFDELEQFASGVLDQVESGEAPGEAALDDSREEEEGL